VAPSAEAWSDSAFAEFADEFDGANVDGPMIDVEQVVGRVFVDGRSPLELGV